jgi:DinB superfamily
VGISFIFGVLDMAIDKTVMHSYKFSVGYLKSLLEGIDADKMTHQFFPGMNHPVWIVGHMAATMEFAAKMAGTSYQAPEGWGELFGMGSNPVDEAGKYPDLATLLAEWDKAIETVAPALEKLTEDVLAAEMPDEGFRQMMPTIGDGLTFILNGHIAMHAGQLSAWRRANGMPPLF